MANNFEIAVKELPTKVLFPSVVSSLNRAATSARQFTADEIKQRLGLSSKDTKAIEIVKAQGKPVNGEYKASLRMARLKVPLIKFGARRIVVQTPRGRRYGVRIRKGGKDQVVKGGFIARMPTGHRGIFRRRHTSSTQSLPIIEMFTAPVKSIFEDKTFNDRVTKFTADVFEKNLQRELAFRESKISR